MTDRIIPPSSGEYAMLLEKLDRISIALESLAGAGVNIALTLQENSHFLCETLGDGLYQLRDNPKAPTRGRGRP